MPQESVTAKWLANLPANVANGVGILLFQTETSIHDVLARELGKSDLEDSGLLILDHLTEEVLSDLAAVNRIREQVITAITSRRPIAASTPLTPPMLAGSQASSAHPSEIDVEELVGRPELAYLLESSCAVASNSEPGSGANYLTAIEKRLAQALSADGIHYREQVPIGRHRVDFLISKTSQPGKLIVECDGAAFHDPELDARRDEVLRAQGYEILRFTGSQIYREAAECAKRVAQALKTQIQPVFIARRDKLSDDQALAVSHTVGPARVAAPAGSGKTRVIENRIQRLVAEGADPNRICAISFTNTAVDEMRHRLGKKAPLLAESVTFTTIHALAKKTAESAGIKKTLVENVRSGQARDTTTLTQLVEQVLDASEYTKQRGGLTS